MSNNIMDSLGGSCTGCGVCASICPLKCIEVKRESNGFYYASTNQKCIGCGLCKSVCNKFYEEDMNNIHKIEKSKGYLMYSLDDKVLEKTSSGGIGKEICEYGLDDGYKVCGVVYDYDQNRAVHKIIDSKENIDDILGSKYIQSYTVEAFNTLEKSQNYIIVGTPCQIYGLRKFMIKNKIDDWVLVDFFCHGTPSLNLWDKYIEMIKRKEHLGKIKSVNFRDKVSGWHNFSVTITDEYGKVHSKSMDKDLFMRIFLENLDLNNPCYQCKFRFNEVFSDIRLGDFWGPKCNSNEKGVSIVLSNTKKGDEIIKKLTDTTYVEEVSFDEIKISQYIKEIIKPKVKSDFQEELKKEVALDQLYKKYVIPLEKNRQLKQKIRSIKVKIKKVIG